jgi:hypothetical protein
MYAAAAKIPLDEILSYYDKAAAVESNFGNVPMDKHYTHTPVRNVDNVELGFQLVNTGRVHDPLPV